jgi:RNA 3'-terminal phosphate cyclase
MHKMTLDPLLNFAQQNVEEEQSLLLRNGGVEIKNKNKRRKRGPGSQITLYQGLKRIE